MNQTHISPNASGLDAEIGIQVLKKPAAPSQDSSGAFKKISWERIRFSVQSLAFLLILINPFLNYYLHINFVQGWYQSLGIGRLWFVSPLEGLESILVSKVIYLPLVIGMLLPVLLAFLLGRVFCGWICPINFLSGIVDRLTAVFARAVRKDIWLLPRYVLWFALLLEVVLAMVMGAPLFVFMSPPGLVGRELMLLVFFHTIAVEGLIILIVLTLNLITRRFYCRYLCPLGGLLALLGAKRRLQVRQDEAACTKCRQCDRACPLGLEPSKGEGASIYCWNCGDCVDACRFKALRFQWRQRP